MACARVIEDKANCLESVLPALDWCGSCTTLLVVLNEPRCEGCGRLSSDGHDDNCRVKVQE